MTMMMTMAVAVVMTITMTITVAMAMAMAMTITKTIRMTIRVTITRRRIDAIDGEQARSGHNVTMMTITMTVTMAMTIEIAMTNMMIVQSMYWSEVIGIAWAVHQIGACAVHMLSNFQYSSSVNVQEYPTQEHVR